ncbi:YlmC/YmxH family sporulation protein [Massilibacterium senegalense]|uniref:YlmC/YmxH family sporulation protein n=1 Tax=Massilibacterium senegalense TaxID=1632858 RepID=UPI000781AEB1|nr:YlmC/YmxH family sporulation protein [Massilibacterium senegalense]
MIKISNLQTKDVINVLDGKKVGYIIDLDIDVDTGKINAFILEPNASVFKRFKKEEWTVLWEQVEKFGSDVILVRLERPVQENIAKND